MRILNLGCGAKTSDQCINMDWSILIRIKRNSFLRLLSTPFVRGERRRKLLDISDNVIPWDMRKGLPFESGSVDAVYHSHMLEHIDREAVPSMQKEILRVLKPGGVQRICVPDLEYAVRCYNESIARNETDPGAPEGHDASISLLLEQSVRKEAFGTSKQSPWRRRLENAMLGDARKRGETHQWMYDRFNLPHLLKKVGFNKVEVCGWNESAIPGWKEIGLELNTAGKEYKPNSLYVEATK